MRLGIVVIFLVLVATSVSAADAQQLVYLIRHGEKEASGDDPRLTEAGEKRAAAWATMFQDSGINYVYTSDARRTKETGTIISEILDVPREELPMHDMTGLIERLASAHTNENVLVIGHAETIPLIVSELGSFDSIAISQTDFDRLIIVAPQGDDEPFVINLRMP